MDNGELRLVKLARKGDREAFTQLVVANERMLSRVAMATLKNPDDAADAVQDTVLQAWESLGQLRQPRYFKTWVVRILLNKCYRISAQRSLYAHSQLEETGYQMLYVINRYRVLSQTPEEAAALLQEIEAASRLKATALVNNSHLGVETRLDTLLGGLDFARKTAQLTGLPLLYSTAPDFALRDGETLPEGFKRIQRHVKFMWE